MARTYPPAVKKAILHVLQSIETGAYQRGSIAPSLKEMSEHAEVSLLTMWKAAAVLKEEGVLKGVHGKRFRFAPAAAFDVAAFHDATRQSGSFDIKSNLVWQRAAQQIRLDVFNGVYGEGEIFPAFKELQHRYNASFLTLKKALEFLCKEEIIKPYKKSYTVPLIVPQKTGRRIVLITWGNIRQELHLEILNEELLRACESYCSRMRLSLEVFGYFLEDNKLRWTSVKEEHLELEDAEDIFGYIYLVVTPEIDPIRIIRQLTHFGKPVAILDLVGGWQIPPSLSKPFFRMFSVAVSPRSGRQVGRYLLDLKHKSIAYISPFHEAAWSHNRLRGMTEVYRSAGLENAVRLFTFENPPVIHEVYQAAVDSQCSYDALRDYYDAWKQRNPDFVRHVFDPYFHLYLPHRILTKAAMGEQLGELFEKALEHKEITAWVLANDDVAVPAMEFLKARGLSVPDEISVIGFDDMYNTLRRGITSFNFNIRAIVHLMLGFVLNTKAFNAYQFKKRAIEVDGIIVERRSSAVAPTGKRRTSK
ncbi:MAG: hypothetical protein GF398_02030 [Chitinivibrionales bacterium]|nr:hypothetical protein [Chitinivibrionales bacterium]